MTTKIGTASSYTDLLNILDAFLTTTGHAWGLRFVGTGNGRMRGPGGTIGGYIGTAASVTETITFTATSATSFNVVGTISGALGVATVGTDFASAVVACRIVAGSTAFIAGDYFTLNTGPKWQRMRFGGCVESTYRTSSYSNAQALFDGTTTSSAVSATTVPQNVKVQMLAPTKVRALSIWSGSSAIQTPSQFNLEYSDDNVAWTTAQSWTGQTWANTYLRKDLVLTADPGAHLYWRLNITASNSGTTTNLAEVRLWADTGMKWDVSTRFEFAWKAPGVDGAQEIFAAGFTITDTGGDAYNLGWRGFRFWRDLEQSIVDVPDNSGSKYHYLAKTPTAYWLTVNGGRLIATTRISGVYEYSYVGFGLPYETLAVHEFPYLVGACGISSSFRWDATGGSMIRNPSDPMSTSTSPTLSSQCSLSAIFPSGVFEGISNRAQSSSSAEGASTGALIGKTWPYSIGTTGVAQTEKYRDAIDGSKPLLPVVIFWPSAPQHNWGEFDGLYWTTGFGNTAEAIVRDGAIDCLVVPNVYRTTLNAFSAVALD